MGSTQLLDQAAAIERTVSVPRLQQLLSDVVPAEDLKPYSEMLGNQRVMVPLGNTADALERINKDLGATDLFAVSILNGALVRVVAALVERNEELEARVRKLEKALAEKSGAKKQGSATKWHTDSGDRS
jgi:hypothetical protein